MDTKLALLIDAENISYKDFPHIIEKIPKNGQVIVKAVYGDWQQPGLQKWIEVAEEHGLSVRHQRNTVAGKSSSDMKLIMDAMDVIYYTKVDSICLVSNDSDYVPLCDKIHELGKAVIGIGHRHASEAFIRSCDQFIFIDPVKLNGHSTALLAPPLKPEPVPKPANPNGLQNLLTNAFNQSEQDKSGWVKMTHLGSTLRQIQPDFQSSAYGHRTLSKLLQSLPDLVEMGDSNATARLQGSSNQNLRQTIRKAFARSDSQDGWVLLSTLGQTLRDVQSGFQSSVYGHATLTNLLQSMPDLVELRTQNGTTAARLKKSAGH